MKRNEGQTDRVLRVVVAVAAVIAALLVGFPSVAAWVLLAVAVVMGVTAAIGFCPLYRLFGIDTCRIAPRTEVPDSAGTVR